MSNQVCYHPEASEELIEAYDYYYARNSRVAIKFDDEVQRYENLIAQDPLRYREIDGIRKCVMIKYPYTLWYQISAGGIQILAVAHHRRKPGYWKRRVSQAR